MIEPTNLDLSPKKGLGKFAAEKPFNEKLIEGVEKLMKENHDKHYASQTIEPINVIEQVAQNLENTKLSAKQKLLVLQALKYLLRLGTKDDGFKEVNKAENYLHRALNGKWRNA